jgi:glycosyl transferase, family 25
VSTNLVKTGFDYNDFSFKDAVYDSFHGGIGCAKSHCEVLIEFILHHTQEYLVVMEDDFVFRKKKEEIEDAVMYLEEKIPDWKVFLLSGSYMLKTPIFESHGFRFCQVLESQTASGYIIRRDFAISLLNCFLEALEGLNKYKNLSPYSIVYSRFAIDQRWKRLQNKGGWYGCDPMFGYQEESYSDIEKKSVNYASVSG